jgi:hypothetical protein
MTTFEFAVLRQVPCLLSVCTWLAADLTDLRSLACTCRTAATRMRNELYFEAAFTLRFGSDMVHWRRNSPWRTLLRTAVNRLLLRTVPRGSFTSDKKAYVKELADPALALAATRALSDSAVWSQLCRSTSLASKWALRAAWFMRLFLSEEVLKPVRLHTDLLHAALQLGGLIAPELPLRYVGNHGFVADLASCAGSQRWLAAGVGLDAAAIARIDADVCVLAAFLTINCSKKPDLVRLPLWPDAVHCQLPAELRPFFVTPCLDDVMRMLTERFSVFRAVYFYPSLDTDPVWSGRFAFAPFDRNLFEERVKRCTRGDRVGNDLFRLLPQAPASQQHLVAVHGQAHDQIGDAELVGFFDPNTMAFNLAKSYRGDAPIWLYRGRLFSWGVGGRWGPKAEIASYSAPWLLLPVTDGSTAFLQRLDDANAGGEEDS